MEMYLVRHGDAAHNTPENFNAALNYPDPDLTRAGETQAHQLGERLRNVPLQRIYTSDLRRAQHTAHILAEYTDAPVEVRSALREINMGRLFLDSWEEIEHDLPGYAARWHRHESDLPYPGGESGADVIQRCMPLIHELAQRHPESAADPSVGSQPAGGSQPSVGSHLAGSDTHPVERGAQVERVVIVTHGGTIRSLLCAFLGIGPEKRFLFGAPLENCGLTVVRWDARRQIFLVHSVNDAAHLD